MPRDLVASDFGPDRKPRAVANPDSDAIRVAATFEPLVTADRHKHILAVLGNRGRHPKR